MKKIIGKNMVYLRNIHGLTEVDVATMLSITLTTLQHWEAGEKLPHVQALTRICFLYQVTLDHLVDENFVDKVSKE